MRKRFALIATAAVTVGLAALVPATADAGTTVNVTLATTGTLSITEPSAAVNLSGSPDVGTVLNGSLGTTTVTDDSGLLAGWTVTAVTDGDLVGTSHTISLGTTVAGGPLTLVTGAVTPSGSALSASVAAGAGGSLNPSSPVTVAVAAPGFGAGTFTYNPTITLTVPANTAADSYSTVVTQTVT